MSVKTAEIDELEKERHWFTLMGRLQDLKIKKIQRENDLATTIAEIEKLQATLSKMQAPEF